MKVTQLKRIEMNSIDLSNDVRYSAVIDCKTLVQYKTDGVFLKHLTLKEWGEMLIAK